MIKVPVPKPVVNRSGQQFLRDAHSRHSDTRSPHHFSVQDDDLWGRWLIRGLLLLLAALAGGFIALSVAPYVSEQRDVAGQADQVRSREAVATVAGDVPEATPRRDQVHSQALQEAVKQAQAQASQARDELGILRKDLQKTRAALAASEQHRQALEKQGAGGRERLAALERELETLRSMASETSVRQQAGELANADLRVDALRITPQAESKGKKGRYHFSLRLRGTEPARGKGEGERGSASGEVLNRVRLVILPREERDNKWTYVPSNAWKRSAGYAIKLDKEGMQTLEGSFRLGKAFKANAVRVEIYGKDPQGYERLLRLRKPWTEVFEDKPAAG